MPIPGEYGELLPGTTNPEDIFSDDLKSLVQSEMLDFQEERNAGAALSYDPNLFKDDLALKVGKSLGVGEEFLKSEDGQKMLYDISDFLMNEQQVDRMEIVSQALATVFNQLSVPMQQRYPEGLAKKLHNHILSRRHKDQMLKANERYYQINKPG